MLRSIVSRSTRAITTASVLRTLPVFTPTFTARLFSKQSGRGDELASTMDNKVTDIRTLRTNLTQQTESDLKELNEYNQEDVERVTAYVNEYQWKVTINEQDESVTASRVVDGATVSVRFFVNETAEGEEETPEEEEEEHEDEDQNERSEEDEDQGQGSMTTPHPFEIEITRTNAKPGTNYMRLQCLATADADLDIRRIIFTEPSADPTTEEQIRPTDVLELDEVSENTQNAFFDYLEGLGIDYQTAQFVQTQVNILRNQNVGAALAKLKAFSS